MAGLVGYASSDEEGEDDQPQLQQDSPQVFKHPGLASAQWHFTNTPIGRHTGSSACCR